MEFWVIFSSTPSAVGRTRKSKQPVKLWMPARAIHSSWVPSFGHPQLPPTFVTSRPNRLLVWLSRSSMPARLAGAFAGASGRGTRPGIYPRGAGRLYVDSSTGISNSGRTEVWSMPFCSRSSCQRDRDATHRQYLFLRCPILRSFRVI
jgi:hypothetical protein